MCYEGEGNKEPGMAWHDDVKITFQKLVDKQRHG